MKLAIIYDKECRKLTEHAYSVTYRDMLHALIDRFDVQEINDHCSAHDIDAEAVLFYDLHSSHHVTIDGIQKHPALKLTYFNDPHQNEQTGRYRNGPIFHKLGAEQRSHRAMERRIDYIICPYRDAYYTYIAPHIDNAEKRLWWMPVAPSGERYPNACTPLTDRKIAVLGNGSINDGNVGGYDFRRWAYSQPCIYYIDHTSRRQDVPRGESYGVFLGHYAASAALNSLYVVPKYLEIPLAGCVCFCQMIPDYRDMGFEDGVNCIAVDKNNLRERVEEFKKKPEAYQAIADAGRDMALKYTAKEFAKNLEMKLVKEH